MKKILLFLLLTISLNASVISFLKEGMPFALEKLDFFNSIQSKKIINKINSIKNGVINDIEKQVKLKAKNTKRVRELSKLDTLENKRFSFLLKKLNKLQNLAVDSSNLRKDTK